MEFMFLLMLEHLVGWLPMFIAGLLAFRLRGYWKLMGLALGAFVILPMPALFQSNPQYATLHMMFLLIGGLAGALLGITMRPKALPSASA